MARNWFGLRKGKSLAKKLTPWRVFQPRLEPLEERVVLNYQRVPLTDLVAGGAGVTTILDNVDDSTASVSLGTSSFRFYGTTYSSLFVSSNGLITFGSANSTFTNTDLTNSGGTISQAAIAPLWDDWVTTGNVFDQVMTSFVDINADAVNDFLVVEWQVYQNASTVNTPNQVTFQSILQLNTGSTDGDIVFNYLDIATNDSFSNGASATVGVKDAGVQGANRVLVSFNTALTSNLPLQFSRNASGNYSLVPLVDLAVGGTGVTQIFASGVDDSVTGFSLGTNTFRLYGSSYTGATLFVSTNGLITFGSGTSTYTNGDLTTNPVEATIAPLWDDWVTLNDGVLARFIDVNGDATQDFLVVEWNVNFITGSASQGTFQAILQLNSGTDNGDITFRYLDLTFGGGGGDNGASATIGVKNAGTQGANRLLVSQDTSIAGTTFIHLVYANVAPTLISNGGPYSVTEGNALPLSATVNDADIGQTLTVNWDIDFNGSIDASTTVVATGANQTVNATLTWAQLMALTPPVNDGTSPATLRNVRVTVSDGVAATVGSTATLAVNNAVPTATSFTNSGPVNEGGTATVTFNGASDPSPVDATSLRFSYDVNNNGLFDDGFGNGTYAGSITATTIIVPAALLADGNASRIVRGIILDKDSGVSGVFTTTIIVNNVPPTIATSGAASVNEGSNYALTLGAITDPGQDTVTQYRVNWGDGFNTGFLAGNPTGQVLNHTYADGTVARTITVDLIDEDGTFLAAGSRSVSVLDVDPTIATSGNASVNEGTNYALTLGAVTDPGADTVSQYRVNWGDGFNTGFLAGNPTGQVLNHTYADGPNNFTITVDLINEDGTFLIAGSRNVTVNDVAPVIATSGAASSNEGASYALTLGAITDPGADTVSQYRVNWGDGFNTGFLAGNPTGQVLNHTYADGPSNFTITVDLVNEDGTFLSAGSRNLPINNVPPTFATSGAASVNEGSSYALTLGAVTDPGQDTVTQYRVNWGDGFNTGFLAGNPTGQVLNHTYADGPNSFTITVDLIDEDGTFLAAGSRVVTVNNVNPTISTSGAASINEGSNYALTLGVITDPGQDTVSQYRVNWGDGFNTGFLAGNPTGQVLNHTYTDGPNNFIITVDLIDEDGTFLAAGSRSVTVNDVAPTIGVSGASNVNEGALYTITLGTVSDSGGDTVSQYRVNWGDGTDTGFINGDPSGQVLNHTYADGLSNATITVDLVNEDGTFLAAGSLAVQVDNVAPTIGLSGASNVNEGTLYTLTLGTVSDPGTDTVTQYRVNWGDGSDTGFILGNPNGQVLGHTYADGANNYIITADLIDEDGTFLGAGTLAVTVDNVTPTIGVSGAASTNEGASYSITLGTVSDPGADTVSQYRVNWGDGSDTGFIVGNPNGQVLGHTYADGTTNATITVDLMDDDGTHIAAGSLLVQVNNVAPTIGVSGAGSVNEGSSFVLTLGAVTDPGQDTVTQYRVNWGDGSDTGFLSGNPTGQVLGHTYADGPNNYTITVDLIDEDGTFLAAGALAVTVNNVVPVVNAGGNATINEGDTFTRGGSFTDPGADSWTAEVDYGDGAGFQALTLVGQSFTLSHTYADNGLFTVTVRVRDDDMPVGTFSTGSFLVQVDNVLPTIGVSGAASINEGASYALTLGAVTDPGTDTVTQYRVNWGDGFNTGFLAGNPTGQVLNHTYVNGNNNYTITVDLIDEEGTYLGAGSLAVQVLNVAPTVTSFTVTGGLSPDGAGTAGSPISFQVAAADPGILDTFTYQFDWNYNGVTFNVQNTLGPVGPAGRSPVSIAHTYAADGTYQPAVRVLDADGGVSTIFLGPVVPVGQVFMQNGNLVVFGSGVADSITVSTANPSNVVVTRNGVTYSGFNLSAPGARVIVRGLAGNDVIAVNGAIPGELFGGDGNDYLYGGTGNDQIWGEAGNDYLSLGGGNDVGIGGLGRDLLYGGNGNDILIGGAIDPLTNTWASLQSASAAWNSYVGVPPSVPPEVLALMAATTDPNDVDNYDRFWGNAGKDAFVYRTSGTLDQINDYKATEFDGLAGF